MCESVCVLTLQTPGVVEISGPVLVFRLDDVEDEQVGSVIPALSHHIKIRIIRLRNRENSFSQQFKETMIRNSWESKHKHAGHKIIFQ